MAVTKTKKPKPSPDLTFDLFAPGMTPLHRAGLGGLAATLVAMERRNKLGLISAEARPGDWSDHKPPWTLESDRLTLHFGEPQQAGDYLRKLFTFAFAIKDKLIDLPGTYRDESNRAVRAELQHGLTLTFLQFGPHRKLDTATMQSFDVDGDGSAAVVVGLRACQSYLHQDAIKRLKLLDKRERIVWKATETPSAFNPGAVVRHNAYGSDTRIEELPPAGIAACFALVGCLSLAVNRGLGVLLIPNVDDLEKFAKARPRMTPTTLRECRVAGTSDAALQAQTRLRARGVMQRHGLSGFDVMRLRPTQWNEKQKTRVATVNVPNGNDLVLSRFDLVLRHLPPRTYAYAESVVRSRGRSKRTQGTVYVWRWTDSIVRPLVADNLASGRRWYTGFTRLMTERDSSHHPNHERVSYEAEGLYAMINEDQHQMTEENERVFIAAIHQAISNQLGKIKSETLGRGANANAPLSQAVKNRWNNFMNRLRLSLINAKTEIQVRGAINLLLIRGGWIEGIKNEEGLNHVHHLIFHDDWQRLRDLTMLAVASHTSRVEKDSSENSAET
ncbi:type I-MYXAN CRISPR-associated Cas8a1/Cmx1 [Thalassoroseus pseudoceratinae]|uniref:type I-MYXAN CRISPR-associated Cas8a1/Cmx1 n=1 Tax=Thalassoroseus pseudoceratinae TaxID=2713176 RepID=UPI0014240CEF|nr:type I-MYXAN CRISPR-associated Cas8a1/Cmx1 [Thalassoroseus pseudoceratinae]